MSDDLTRVIEIAIFAFALFAGVKIGQKLVLP